MRPIADIIWCGASAPVVQGILVGLGIAAVGLVIFPFNFILVRPVSGRQSDYDQASTYIRWSRRVSWAAAVFTSLALAGYVIIYSDSYGKFCSAHFDHDMQVGIIAWTVVCGVTFALLALVGILRALTQHLSR
jgi:hypothetical protein